MAAVTEKNRELSEIFGQRMMSRLYELDMSQAELSRRIDITKHALWAYSSGNSCPNLATAHRIALELGVSLDWLCGLDERNEAEEKQWKAVLKEDITAKLDRDLATLRNDIMTLFERRQV